MTCKMHGISQESPFDTRYFTVTIAPDGTVESVDTGKIASISAGTAEEYAAELWKKGKKKGFFADYKYLATDSDGSTMYVFLNCQREISTIRTYVLTSVGTGALGLVIVFVMIYFFSGKVLNRCQKAMRNRNALSRTQAMRSKRHSRSSMPTPKS